MKIILLILTVCLSIYDLRTRRVPNWITLPLLITGLLLHFPGMPEIWLGCVLLFSTWRLGVLGGGDAKLWMALLWLIPFELVHPAVLTMAVVFLLTAIFQLSWRKLSGRPMWGVRSPGAWRTIPFVIWLLTVSG